MFPRRHLGSLGIGCCSFRICVLFFIDLLSTDCAALNWFEGEQLL